jgi:hypothetical protein
MPTFQVLNDTIRLLMQLMPAMALLCLLLAGVALRTEGGSTFVIGGSFTRWVLWAVIMLSLPQLLLWFNFFGLPTPVASGAIGTSWLNGIQVDVSTFVNDFLIDRVTVVLAAFFVLRALLDAAHGGSPLSSVLTAMFLLAIPTTANLLSDLETGTRFSAVDVLDGLWTYLAGRIMPVAAGLAVISAIFNFVMQRPAGRFVGAAIGFLTVSALWRLVQQMM